MKVNDKQNKKTDNRPIIEKKLLKDFEKQIDSFEQLANIFNKQGKSDLEKLSMVMKNVAEACYAKVWGDVYGWKK